jgi:hypothetical protein
VRIATPARLWTQVKTNIPDRECRLPGQGGWKILKALRKSPA